jgi:hypothetical protein
MLRAGLVAVCLFATAAAMFALHCSTVQGSFQPSLPAAAGTGIAGYARPEDDTFLTYAEWYIVWSYQEKAAWQQTHLPSGFPYFRAIGQYWSGYCCSYRVVRGRYPFNFGDHLMLAVIGTSFTVEYGLKGLYENTIGRLAERLGGAEMSEEDRYAARIANDYGIFVANRPFYEFPFSRALHGLWSDTRTWGPRPLRKWERKVWLSLDYGVEALYCGAIRLASHAVYGIEDDVTYVWVERASDAVLAGVPGVQQVKSMGAGAFLLRLPRYQKFTETAAALLRGGARFVEVAGNRQIMVTAVVSGNKDFHPPAGERLFASGILTDALSERIAIRVPVADLGTLFGVLPIEHIYDY